MNKIENLENKLKFFSFDYIDAFLSRSLAYGATDALYEANNKKFYELAFLSFVFL